ncbi:MAG TPA: hypothetical protein VHO66_02325 [Ruminiclostridium sp.]|nr:hypothetical protein [Ruminiclostridium sp.]
MENGFWAYLWQGGINGNFRKGKCERDKGLKLYATCIFISFFH